jgi:hypothetical protein
MLTIAAFGIFRQVFKGAKASAKLSGLMDAANHPRIHHAYYSTAIVVYAAHIAVSLHKGFEIEGTITAAAALIELVAHLSGE